MAFARDAESATQPWTVAGLCVALLSASFVFGLEPTWTQQRDELDAATLDAARSLHRLRGEQIAIRERVAAGRERLRAAAADREVPAPADPSEIGRQVVALASAGPARVVGLTTRDGSNSGGAHVELRLQGNYHAVRAFVRLLEVHSVPTRLRSIAIHRLDASDAGADANVEAEVVLEPLRPSTADHGT